MRTLLAVAMRLAHAAIILTTVLYALVLRPWHMRWGATTEELDCRLAGDRFIADGAVVSTRAVEIAAPAAEVWLWLLQLGQGRGGFYSYEWLENLFAAEMRNAETIDPRLLRLRVGDTISFQHEGPSTIVRLIEPGRAIVLGDGWTIALRPLDEERTRLVVRYPYGYDSVLDMLYYYTIFEPAHFVMESGMMLGIKERAERSYPFSRREGTVALEGAP